MATSNTKTPVMVLQELTVRKGIQCPEYSIIHAREGTHDNEFHYQVLAASVSAIGVGRSKQVAKQNAASKALELLAKNGSYCPGQTPLKVPRSETVDSPVKVTVNSIGSLGELCAENKISRPTFEEISDVGPPHCKEFTYQCQVASLVTRATAGTKKQAKQLAANEMLEKISHMLPELVAQCNESTQVRQAILDKEMEAAEQYILNTQFSRPKPNLAIRIEDYSINIKNILKEKDMSVDDIQMFFNEEQTEETLTALLAKLELNFMIEKLQESPLIVLLTINTDVPFRIFASGENYTEISKQIIQMAFQHLDIFFK